MVAGTGACGSGIQKSDDRTEFDGPDGHGFRQGRPTKSCLPLARRRCETQHLATISSIGCNTPISLLDIEPRAAICAQHKVLHLAK
jgi:hypothetical protein